MTPEHDSDNDLAWLAFQYAAGELSLEATSAFEERLDADQAAREALAGAVGLTEALFSAEVLPSSVVRVGTPRRTHRRLAALGAAACVLVAFAVGPRWLDRDDARPDPSPSAVGLAWSGLRAASEPFIVERTDDWLDWIDEPSSESEVSPDSPEDDGPPGWLLEAVALRETDPPDPEQTPQGL